MTTGRNRACNTDNLSLQRYFCKQKNNLNYFDTVDFIRSNHNQNFFITSYLI